MNFIDKLNKAINKSNSLLCIGLDSDRSKIKEGQFLFNKRIIKATHDLVCSYKLNTAFYEAIGHVGIKALKDTCDYLHHNHPDIPIIIDAKRGDIGNTNQGYVQFVFTYLNGDAVTINPYLGSEAIGPFLSCKDKGIIVLCRTSNMGAGEFQDVEIKNCRLFEYIAYKVSHQWNKNNNCLLVVGATYPKELKEIRRIVGDQMFFLIPGIGAQGGDVKATLKAGLNTDRSGLIINSSRSIIFSDNPRQKAMELRDEINQYR